MINEKKIKEKEGSIDEAKKIVHSYYEAQDQNTYKPFERKIVNPKVDKVDSIEAEIVDS